MSYTKTKGWGIASQGAVSTHGISPPEGVAAGDRVLVDSVATDDFATHDNEIAEWTGAAWVFSAEIAVGDTVFVESESKNFVYTGTSWTSTGGGGGGGGGGEDLAATLALGNTTGGVHIEGQTQIVLGEAAGPVGAASSGAIFVSDGVAAGEDANHLYYQPTSGDAISLSIHAEGTHTHSEIDTHIDEATVHFTEGSIDHTSISNIGTLTHGEIDTHVGATDNPHGTDIENLGSGTLAELNAAITDFDLDAAGSPRPPTAHSSEHLTGGLDEIGVFEGADGVDGTEGLVPPPLVADAEKFLKGDGSWQDVSAGADGSAPIARSFLVEFNAGEIKIDEVPNADIELLRGFTYEFFEAVLTSPGHPFIISTISEGAALATSLPSDPEDYDYYVDGDNIIFRPSHDAAITSYYYHCDDHAGEGGTILLSTLGEHDEGGGAIVNPYIFTQGNDNPGTPYVIAADAYHIGVETDDGTLLMSLPDPDDVEVGMTYIISDVDGTASGNFIDIQVVPLAGGSPTTGKLMGTNGVQINTDWGYVQVVNVQRSLDDRMWVIVSSFGTVLTP